MNNKMRSLLVKLQFSWDQGCRFVIKIGEDKNHELECGLKIAGDSP